MKARRPAWAGSALKAKPATMVPAMVSESKDRECTAFLPSAAFPNHPGDYKRQAR